MVSTMHVLTLGNKQFTIPKSAPLAASRRGVWVLDGQRIRFLTPRGEPRVPDDIAAAVRLRYFSNGPTTS